MMTRCFTLEDARSSTLQGERAVCCGLRGIRADGFVDCTKHGLVRTQARLPPDPGESLRRVAEPRHITDPTPISAGVGDGGSWRHARDHSLGDEGNAGARALRPDVEYVA